MFTNTKCSIYAGQDKVYTESVCLSTDVKPTTGIANGSTCIEMNTGKKFMFNEDSGEWVEVPSSGGGGGGGGSSDFSTAQVTVTFAIPNTVLYIPTIVDMDEVSFANDMIMESGTYPVILYKGTSIGVASADDDSFPVSVEVISGDAEASDEEVIITGDCTITVTAS